MAALESANPGMTLVYATMPLTNTSNSDNIKRNVFNDAVRTYCSTNGKFLFDIADIESHDPNGTAVTFADGGQTYWPAPRKLVQVE
jgi:hypothetical protein